MAALDATDRARRQSLKDADMPIAAVPKFLGADFSTAAPGHRFGMYLKVWGVNAKSHKVLWTTSDENYRETGPQRLEREFKDVNDRGAFNEALKLTPDDKEAMNALTERQSALARSCSAEGRLLRLDAVSIAPFATGLGNEHPLENGFAFLNPYGLPYLPGSGVKGVLRRAAEELRDGVFGVSNQDGWTDAALQALFGVQDGEGDPRRGALSFWDVVPRLKGDHLQVEVMTPHQNLYLQGNESPHDSGSPNPICFLSVPPGSQFTFYVRCDLSFLERIAPDLVADVQWKGLMQAAFTHAFDWLGFGAKTAVGYGAMARDHEAEGRAAAEAQRASELAEAARLESGKQARLALMSINMQGIETFITKMSQLHLQLQSLFNPHGQQHQLAKDLAKAALEGSGWNADERRAAALAIEGWLPKVVRLDMKEERKKLRLRELKGDQ